MRYGSSLGYRRRAQWRAAAWGDRFKPVGQSRRPCVTNEGDSMRLRNFLTLLIALAAPAVLLGQAKGSRLAVMSAGDLKWADLDTTRAPGVKVADVWGNHAKGAFGA